MFSDEVDGATEGAKAKVSPGEAAAAAASAAFAAQNAGGVPGQNIPFVQQIQNDPQASAWFQLMIGTAAVVAAAAMAA